MKKLLFILMLFSLLIGCNTTTPKKTANKFPQIMVGAWEAKPTDFNTWGIKFEPDGSIEKIIHAVVGPILLAEGGIVAEGPDPNTYMLFEIGDCDAVYNSKTRQLDVRIIVDNFEFALPQGTLEGRAEDYFSGPISEDGKTWKVKWWAYSWLEGATPPDVNYIKANPEELVFYKIDLESDPNSPTQ